MEYKGYTIEVVGKTENGRAYLVDVKATKGAEVKERQFDGIVSLAGLRSAVKGWIDTDELKAGLPDSGNLDFTEPEMVETVKTKAELDKESYDKNRERLRVIMELVRDGVFTGNETQIVNLQNKVKTNFKVEYLG